MHIAVCNDNVADRKQLERLLARESDKRLSTSGNLYVDSYGHPDSLLKNPMQFDAFFIDMELTPDISDSSVLQCLIKAGCSAPVILFYASPEEKEEKRRSAKMHPWKFFCWKSRCEKKNYPLCWTIFWFFPATGKFPSKSVLRQVPTIYTKVTSFMSKKRRTYLCDPEIRGNSST